MVLRAIALQNDHFRPILLPIAKTQTVPTVITAFLWTINNRSFSFPYLFSTAMFPFLLFGAVVIAAASSLPYRADAELHYMDTLDESELFTFDPSSPGGSKKSHTCVPSGQRYDSNADGHCGAHARKEQRREEKRTQTIRRKARKRRGLGGSPPPPPHKQFFQKNQFKGPPEKPAAPSSGTKFVPTQTKAEVGEPVQKVSE